MATLDEVYALVAQVSRQVDVVGGWELPDLAASQNAADNSYGAYFYDYTLIYPGVLNVQAILNELTNDLNHLITDQNARLSEIRDRFGAGPDRPIVAMASALTALNVTAREGFNTLTTHPFYGIFGLGNHIAGQIALTGYATESALTRLADAIAEPTSLDEMLAAEIGASTVSDAMIGALPGNLGYFLDRSSLKKYASFAGAGAWLNDAGAGMLKSAVRFTEGALEDIHAPAVALATLIVDDVQARLRADAPATPRNVQARAADALSVQIGLGVKAHLIALAVESLPYLKHIGFPQLAAFLVDGAGFKKVSDAVVGSYLDASIGIPGRQDALSTMVPGYPGPSVLEELVQKREISLDAYREGLQIAGYRGEWQAAIEGAVWRDFSVRDMTLIYEDANVDPAFLLAAVQRAGYSDDDAERIKNGLVQRATKSARGRLAAAAIKGVKQGLLDPSEADQWLETAGLRPEVRTVEITAAQLDARLDLINDTAAVFSQECIDGLINTDELRTLLTSIGVQDARSDVMVLRVMGRLGKRRLDEEATAAETALRDAQRHLLPLYRDLFRSGVMSGDAFLSALRFIGIRDELAAAIVSLERQRVVADVQERQIRDLQTFQRRVLSDRQQILKLQVQSGLIGVDDYGRALAELGVNPTEAQTLVLEARVRLGAQAKVATELSDEARLRAVRDERRRLLTDLYRAGQIGPGSLLSGLIAAGVSRELAELIVEREELARDLAAQP